MMLLKTIIVLVMFDNFQGLYSSVQNENNTVDTSVQAEDPEVTNHEKFRHCRTSELAFDEYVMFPNNTAYVAPYNKTYNESFYLKIGNKIRVCYPGTENGEQLIEINEPLKFPWGFMYMTIAGIGISMLCLLIHIIAFCLVPALRNLPGYNLFSLCLSLLLAYLSFLVSHAKSVHVFHPACVTIAATTQFFMLASFFWMGTMSFDVFRSLLKATGKLRVATKRFSVTRYLSYCFFSWGLSIAFVIVTLLLDNLDGVPQEYKPMIGEGICWFNQRHPLLILFAAPLFVVMGANVLFFGLSAYVIYANRMKTEQAAYRTMLQKNMLMYFRLMVIMGLTWLVGILASYVDAMWLWYIYVLLNTLQGFFIFLAFTCTAKVKAYAREKLWPPSRKTSSQSSTPTFQSYWNSGFSEESEVSIEPKRSEVSMA